MKDEIIKNFAAKIKMIEPALEKVSADKDQFLDEAKKKINDAIESYTPLEKIAFFEGIFDIGLAVLVIADMNGATMKTFSNFGATVLHIVSTQADKVIESYYKVEEKDEFPAGIFLTQEEYSELLDIKRRFESGDKKD